jgi:hypothetical protein
MPADKKGKVLLAYSGGLGECDEYSSARSRVERHLVDADGCEARRSSLTSRPSWPSLTPADPRHLVHPRLAH